MSYRRIIARSQQFSPKLCMDPCVNLIRYSVRLMIILWSTRYISSILCGLAVILPFSLGFSMAQAAEDQKTAVKVAQQDPALKAFQGYMQQGKPAHAMAALKQGAEQGSLPAMMQLGMLMVSQPDPTKQVVGCEWLSVAAEKNYKPAFFQLAGCYQTGRGRPIDIKKAVALFDKARLAGDPRALCAYGAALARGQGVEKANPQEGLALCEQAAGYAGQGDKDLQAKRIRASAKAEIGALYLEGKAVERAPDRAISYLKQAASEGHAQAAYNLSIMYQLGDGVEKDPVEEEKWALQAVEQRYPPAFFLLGRLLADQHIDLQSGKLDSPKAKEALLYLSLAGLFEPDRKRRAFANKMTADILKKQPALRGPLLQRVKKFTTQPVRPRAKDTMIK